MPKAYIVASINVTDPDGYARQIAFGERYTTAWDDPE